ncbi:bacteriohemerythrin [Geobacter sp. OR-1]|uniref:bacteriohemerythrin n=1 Tax=Geobacter sp. OR-1 TaxID=1266765 RepID=UPI0005442094|nr:bacteriohemerythrin [Geobacter sp. OR-1]GAM09213.1 bacteriohemerythrin [Geobacter sp. OR-1]
MKIEWNEDLAVGVEYIDEQHKELFRRFNRLLEACSKGSGTKEIGSLLFFLDEYVRIHFNDEEKLQVANSFPEYPAHREQHRIFINKLDDFKNEMQTGGATLSLTIATNRMLIDWLLNHIAKMDKKIGEFISQNT